MDEKTQKLLAIVSEKIIDAKREVSIPNHDNLEAFNQVIIRNPGHIIFYNNLYVKIKEVRLNAAHKLEMLYAKMYCEYKMSGEKMNNGVVENMIYNLPEYQDQKRIVIRLESLEDALKGILSGFRAQLDALQTICNNLRAERRTI